ncbi:3D domain-containing protein [Paenibacillus gansuensis]|uniref:3D domain-containing protein n=1 Tax=Paenibacillus gansuensis TaxID=306542 RepID=A0ABW5PH19_9BACL
MKWYVPAKSSLLISALFCSLFFGAAAVSAHDFIGSDPHVGRVKPNSTIKNAAAVNQQIKPVSRGVHLAAPAVKQLKYRVNTGDTLYRIARKFGVTVDALQAVNRIHNPNQLSVGAQLEVPQKQISAAKTLLAGKQVVAQVITAKLTAYTAGFESTGKRPSHPAYGITSSGAKVKEGRTIAVDPKIIPIGSTVYIEGIGIRRAEDTGSAIKGARIDVFMKDLKKARKFGVKKDVKVYVLSGPQDRASL